MKFLKPLQYLAFASSLSLFACEDAAPSGQETITICNKLNKSFGRCLSQNPTDASLCGSIGRELIENGCVENPSEIPLAEIDMTPETGGTDGGSINFDMGGTDGGSLNEDMGGTDGGSLNEDMGLSDMNPEMGGIDGGSDNVDMGGMPVSPELPGDFQDFLDTLTGFNTQNPSCIDNFDVYGSFGSDAARLVLEVLQNASFRRGTTEAAECGVFRDLYSDELFQYGYVDVEQGIDISYTQDWLVNNCYVFEATDTTRELKIALGRPVPHLFRMFVADFDWGRGVRVPLLFDIITQGNQWDQYIRLTFLDQRNSVAADNFSLHNDFVDCSEDR